MVSVHGVKDKLLFSNLGRLKLTLSISMLGFLADTLITRWMLSSQNGFYESNTTLFPQIGIPLMVLNFVLFDLIIPKKNIYDNIFYTLSILQWSGPVQNILVLFHLTPGINFYYALPFIFTASFIILNFKLNREKQTIN
jgi:hypothetical protein